LRAPLHNSSFFRPDHESQPIFIVGDARSGTTMLRLMLNASPSVAVLSETWFATRIWERRWAFPPVEEARHFFASLLDSFIALLGKIEHEFPVDMVAYRRAVLGGPLHLNRMLSELGQAYALREQKQRWGEKTPVHCEYVPILLEMFPKANFVHIVREPRDVIASQLRIGSLSSSDPLAIALRWRRIVREAIGFARSMPDHHLVLRYEDLVAAPEVELRNLCSHLGIAYEASMLDFHKGFGDYAPRQDHMRKLNEPLNATSIGRWRSDLDNATLTLVEMILFDDMVSLGYVPATRTDATQRALVERCVAAEVERTAWALRPYSDYVRLQRGGYRDLLQALEPGSPDL
jgi:hypothetical protein